MIDSCWYFDKDIDQRDFYAVLYEILIRICKKTKIHKEGKDDGWGTSIETCYYPVDELDLRWIIARANFYSCDGFGMPVFPIEMLSWLNESPFVPERFDVEWSDNKEDYSHLDYLSGADRWAIRKAVHRYKLYGRYTLWLSCKYFLLKRRIFHRKGK